MASTLCLLSDDEVGMIAAFDITDTGDLYDPRFGNAGSTEVECRVCGMRSNECLGHYASLDLGVSIFHPLVYKESERIINSVCFGCMVELPRIAKSKSRRCPDCNIVNHGDYTIYQADMSRAVRPNKTDYKLASSIPSDVLPPGYILSRVLVPPIHLRTPEEMEWSGDLQKLYAHLLEVVRKKRPAHEISNAYYALVGVKKNEGIIGLMSGKNGVFRKFALGKRVEYSARAVVVGDPSLDLDEVAVPKIAQLAIRVKVRANQYNIRVLRELASTERLWWEGTDDLAAPRNICAGMVFERELANGDYVMLNRQPSLSKQSLTCFKVVVRKDAYNVFGINPQSTPPFNADFDGDEMNVFFMSHTSPPECRAELMELCHVKNDAPVQDVVTGCYMMSIDDLPVEDSMWGDCVVLAGCDDCAYPRTTYGILSMCIPGYDGRVLTKGSIFKDGVDLRRLQLVVERWLSKRGLSVSYSSVNIGSMPREPGTSADAYREMCIQKAEKSLTGTGLIYMIKSGAKGTFTHAAHMAVAIGQQYISGQEGVFINDSYSRGLKPEEFFGHQMAAREGVVSTGVSTADTGYLNRRACKIMADVLLQYNGTIADNTMVSSFHMSA